MSVEHNKYKALYLISQKAQPKHIAEQIGISYATVLRYRAEYEAAERDGYIQELLNFPSAILEDIMELAADRAPVVIDDELNLIREGVSGLKKLEKEFQLTATTIAIKLRSMAMVTESAGEIGDLTDSLCNLQKSFFSKDTNILVQQNNTGNNVPEGQEFAYGGMLDDKPKDY